MCWVTMGGQIFSPGGSKQFNIPTSIKKITTVLMTRTLNAEHF